MILMDLEGFVGTYGLLKGFENFWGILETL
jgi:hypothetical protein